MSIYEIKRLKKIIKKQYPKYLEEVDNYSCGLSVAEYMNPRIKPLRVEINSALDQLAKLDPENAPKTRL